MRPIEDDRWSGPSSSPATVAPVCGRGVARWVRHLATGTAQEGRGWRGGGDRDRGGAGPHRGRTSRAERAEAADDLRILRSALAACAARDPRRVASRRSTRTRCSTAMRRHPDRSFASRSAELWLVVDRQRARFGAWYELFPRSQGRDPQRPTATTFPEAEWRLADIAAMGFDVVYLPPIHPIGRTNRKGRNNALEARAPTPARRTRSARRTVATTPSRRSLAGSRG